LEVKEIFGGAMRKARNQKGISQAQLAFDAGLDRSYISKLETGIYQPSISTLFAIAEVLEVSPDKLVKEVYEIYLKMRK